MSAELEPGLGGEASMIVSEGDTAPALGSGDVPVLGTPRVVALCEQATVAAVAHAVPSGHTTVGVEIRLAHLRATAIGVWVTADAMLSDVDGRRLVFDVSVRDDLGTVAHGRVVRTLVDRARFLASLSGD